VVWCSVALSGNAALSHSFASSCVTLPGTGSQWRDADLRYVNDKHRAFERPIISAITVHWV